MINKDVLRGMRAYMRKEAKKLGVQLQQAIKDLEQVIAAELRAAEIVANWLAAPQALAVDFVEDGLIPRYLNGGWTYYIPIQTVADIRGWRAHKEGKDVTDPNEWAGWLAREMLVDRPTSSYSAYEELTD